MTKFCPASSCFLWINHFNWCIQHWFKSDKLTLTRKESLSNGYKMLSEFQNDSGAPNDRFLGNICSEPSRMAKIFESPRTAKNFENVSWWLTIREAWCFYSESFSCYKKLFWPSLVCWLYFPVVIKRYMTSLINVLSRFQRRLYEWC